MEPETLKPVCATCQAVPCCCPDLAETMDDEQLIQDLQSAMDAAEVILA